jgi:hypothetical protein
VSFDSGDLVFAADIYRQDRRLDDALRNRTR